MLIRRSNQRRRLLFPFVGTFLALGSPVGYLVVRAISAKEPITMAWFHDEIRSDLSAYVYLLVSTVTVFVILGRFLGRTEDLLQEASSTDPLTGLGNRRWFYQRFASELSRANRLRMSIGLLLIDLDGLKNINDQLSHREGDEALKAVADAIRISCRATDVACRFGGDEFAVVATVHRTEEVLELAERIRKMVSDSPSSFLFKNLSVSIGAASSEMLPIVKIETLITIADRAMYQAKAGGKNRVVFIQSNGKEQAIHEGNVREERGPPHVTDRSGLA